MYKRITTFNRSKAEDDIIQFWQDNKIFEKSITNRSEDNVYSFIDGPPFVSGNMHYGHILASVAKDIVPRYWTMKGKRVRRVWGWDCHGLPIEAKVNEKYNIKTASEVEKSFGVENYVKKCREYVLTNIASWQWYINKIGRWVDLDNAYKTMDANYGESVLWSFKEIYKKGLIYQGKRVSMYSTDTQTPVSSFEVAMDTDNYQDTTDTAVFVGFKLVDSDEYILAWTTTPWTLPSNFALAVNQNENYAKLNISGKIYYIAEKRIDYLKQTLNLPVEILATIPGTTLIGKKYFPLYNDLNQNNPSDYTIYSYDGVSMEEGTGVLHIAPAFGEEDFQLGKKFGLSDIADIDEEGIMQVGPAKGMYLRDASSTICANLTQKGNLLGSHPYLHRLPYYRGKNPLIYMAQDAYFIDIQKIKSRMLELNQQINWIPEHIKNGRFFDTIKNSPDWNISRSRFWATIMPIWQSADGDQIVIGSYAELAKFTTQVQQIDGTWYFIEENGQKVPLTAHRDVCDKIILTQNNKQYHRIPEVLDCWMDSASVPFAEYHYPFENEDYFKKLVPAEFIVEYVGQVRAWFNVLLRVSTILFDSNSFTNVICTGTLAGNDGRKMSKTYGNYPDPKQVLETQGGDATRLYLMSSTLMSGGDTSWSDLVLKQQTQSVLLPLQNTVNFFVIYAQKHNYKALSKEQLQKFSPKNIINQWIQSRLVQFAKEFVTAMDAYQIPEATRLIQPFIDDLSTWYIRSCREQFDTGDTEYLDTLFYVLFYFSHYIAPIIPFTAEDIYLAIFKSNITGLPESIHLADLPNIHSNLVNDKLLNSMRLVRDICNAIHASRQEHNLKIRQPLGLATITSSQIDLAPEFIDLILNETNIKSLNFVVSDSPLVATVDTHITPELKDEGDYRELVRSIQTLRKNQGLGIDEQIQIVCPSWPKSYEAKLLQKTKATIITKGDILAISKV